MAEGLGVTTESLRAWRRPLGGAEAVPATAAEGKPPAIAPSAQELQAEVRRLRAASERHIVRRTRIYT